MASSKSWLKVSAGHEDRSIYESNTAVQRGNRRQIDVYPTRSKIIGVIQIAAQPDRENPSGLRFKNTKKGTLVIGRNRQPVCAQVIGAVDVARFGCDKQMPVTGLHDVVQVVITTQVRFPPGVLTSCICFIGRHGCRHRLKRHLFPVCPGIACCQHQAVCPDGNPILLSTDGGSMVRWSPNGDGLFYKDGRRWYWVALTDSEEEPFAQPELWLEGDFLEVPGFDFAVARDGRRLLLIQGPADRTTAVLSVVTNFFEELKAKVGN